MFLYEQTRQEAVWGAALWGVGIRTGVVEGLVKLLQALEFGALGYQAQEFRGLGEV